MAEPIQVLLVDDEPSVGALAAESLEQSADHLAVTTATSAEDGLEIIEADTIDCVVSDYDMPGGNGIEFLETVRAEHADLPFVLFTAKGSEEIASDAISAGATDYLQKETGVGQYEILANRVTNVVEQRRAAARARETQRQLQSLAENSNDILWMFDANWSELRFINEAYEAIWGRPVEELREEPRSFLEGIHPEDRPLVREAMSTLTSGEPVDIEYRVNAAEDYGRWVWVQGMPVTGPDGEVESVAGFARDVTDRKAREVELEATNDQLRALQRQFELTLEATDTYAWRMDLEDDTVERTPSVGTIFDVDADALESVEDFFELVHPDHRDRLRDALEALRSDGASYQVRYRLRTGDGWVWVEEQGDMLDERTAIGLVSDITPRRERELALERERDRLSTLFENFPEPAIEYEFVDGEPVVRDVNEAFVGTFGYDPETARGATINELVVPPERYDEARSLDEQVLEGERLDVEVRRQAASGERDFRIRNIATPDHARSDGYAIYSDITDRRDRERQLEHQNARLEEFASVISHDLRNPLNVLMGSVELGEETGDPEAFARSRRAMARMEQLIDDTLTLARAGQAVADVEPVALTELIDACWSTVETADAELRDQATLTLAADPSRLQQLLENLVRNAVEHGGPDVTVTIGDLDDGFYVEDDGPGIPAEVRDAVFDSGFTTAEDGTGYGLAIVEQIAAAHGWEVDVAIGKSGGARFDVTGVERLD